MTKLLCKGFQGDLKASFADAIDIFTSYQSVSDGRTLVSREGIFELGFFSPGSSRNRYLGIWYKKIPVQSVIWVANRNNPIHDTTGLLIINRKGNLVLLSRRNGVVWYTDIKKGAQNPVVQLLDSGNLVMRSENESNSETFLWQSFDYPCDTLLPGMKLGWDLRTGLDRRLSAWKNSDDPSPGDFTVGVELYQYPDIVARKGSNEYVRTGPWNGLRFSGSPILRPNSIFENDFVWNEQEVYQVYNVKNKSLISRYMLNQNTYQGQHYIWIEKARSWMMITYIPRDICDSYDRCGPYGICVSTEVPPCQCLKRFKPKSSQNLYTMDLNPGCERSKPLNCQKGDGFIKYFGLKVPDTANSWVNRSMSFKECRARCFQNCSCMAYTPTDIRGEGSGCALWFGHLIDIKLVQDGGQDLYIRMSASEVEPKGHNKMKIAVIVPIAIFIVAGLLFVSCYICRSRASLKGFRENHVITDRSIEGQGEDSEVQLFDLALIANATNDFSTENKLGQGGFGPVYRGTLADGQEIAVKRLSKSSGQGLTEFKNEVALIAKLQHRNLVKLLGCCIQGEEKMLVYEYMPNKSLDFFIFEKTRSKLLDWPKRFNIICGVARGLVYLHQDSRLRIIHRDLKASNVLLDIEMNPKISDFGMARTFGGDQFEGNTNRVVGTYGYMAPEYAIDGQFSVKSDVFSFGILVLEIISGKKNRGFYNPGHGLNLIGHAWELWKEGKPLELIDPLLKESCNISEVIRGIHIGLLCVQQHPEDRPSMSSVVLMLGSDTELIQPKQPNFLIERKLPETDSSSSKLESSSTNDISMSILTGR
ncbi:G-type lectin S-receptor-like serine/threonine-protein kinase At4g27290 isoform X3 [Durio zibethinus]|uniref:Receptor-like serine/threonine-protein kinase n=1 Tax=Durio zibethinus TaxID=66656 RepID=A0A6P5ZLJ5_DURZI|nr:G-type lectin S-receptor-like serine/threonine-protein kinase At4g27290 isoform X3 [Durio zibethinus]XP_022753197.1 G-type lectin S-receptor-like serine/threonine-protein kinase At4g27290 isoform X3 [Durio zibethinus]